MGKIREQLIPEVSMRITFCVLIVLASALSGCVSPSISETARLDQIVPADSVTAAVAHPTPMVGTDPLLAGPRRN